MPNPRRRGLLLALLLAAGPAFAEDPPATPKGFWERDTLTGDWAGARPRLVEHGITVGVVSTDDGSLNLSGGLSRGTGYAGNTVVTLDFDFAAMADGLAGWTGRASAGQVRSDYFTLRRTGVLATTSSQDYARALQLRELWVEKTVLDGALSLRLGQQLADVEFLVSPNAVVFVNAAFGFPTIGANDLPFGGPVTPYATPAVRLKLAPTPEFALLFAAFNGSPISRADSVSGTDFRIHDDPLYLVEAQYLLNQGKDPKGPPGSYKLGVYMHTGRFPGLTFTPPAYSLVASTIPHRTNWRAYAMIDQALPPIGDHGTIAVFARVTAGQDDRNIIPISATAGATWTGLVPSRKEDVIGLAVAYATISNRVNQAIDTQNLGLPAAQRMAHVAPETTFELTYQAAITGWWKLQPDLQYTLRPGGGALAGTPRHLAPVLAAGFRSVITF